MEEKIKQLQAKLEADAKLGEKIFSQETPEAVQAVLKEEGLDFSLEEIEQLRGLIVKALEKGGEGELSDEDLEEVAGGVGVIAVLGCVAGLVTAGAAALGAIGGVVDSAVRNRW